MIAALIYLPVTSLAVWAVIHRWRYRRDLKSGVLKPRSFGEYYLQRRLQGKA